MIERMEVKGAPATVIWLNRDMTEGGRGAPYARVKWDDGRSALMARSAGAATRDYDPSEPRVPKGGPGGGEWTSGGGGGGKAATGQPGPAEHHVYVTPKGARVEGPSAKPEPGPAPARTETAGGRPAPVEHHITIGPPGSTHQVTVETHGPASALMRPHAASTPRDEAGQVAKGAEIAKKVGADKLVAEAREKLKTVTPTNRPVKEGGFLGDDGQYTPERQKVHERILDSVFTPEAVKAATPPVGERPVMTILGGRGGSGKSWLTGPQGPIDASKTLVLDSDHLKSLLPEYQGWNAAQMHEESSAILKRAMDTAIKLGLNTTLDMTMTTASSVAKRIEQFKKAGYDIDGYYMHLPPAMATERAMGRFKSGMEKNGKGRFVPPEIIMSAVDNEKNFDNSIPQFRHWGVYENTGSAPRHVVSG